MYREAFRVMSDPHNSQMGRLVSAVFALAWPLLIFFPLLGGVSWLQASHEAAAFNRLTTGPKVTTWDAVWLDLRVEAR